MKICPVCRYTVSDDADFCTQCGAPFATHIEPDPALNNNTVPPASVPPYAYAPVHNPHDHTGEFDAQDITANKLYASLPYLLSVFGVIIALLIAKESAFVMFHVRQSLKLILAEVIFITVAVALIWTIVAPLVAAVGTLALLILQYIGFYQAVTGKATDLILIRNFKI